MLAFKLSLLLFGAASAVLASSENVNEKRELPGLPVDKLGGPGAGVLPNLLNLNTLPVKKRDTDVFKAVENIVHGDILRERSEVPALSGVGQEPKLELTKIAQQLSYQDANQKTDEVTGLTHNLAAASKLINTEVNAPVNAPINHKKRFARVRKST